jgi:hypothetical protein
MDGRRRRLAWLLLVALAGASSAAPRPPAPAGDPDCNGNGVPDDTDIALGTSLDCNGNGVPDECDTAVSFATLPISGTADEPRALHAADLDGDGDADLLSATSGDHTIAWYENTDGAGTFGARQVVSAAVIFASSVHAADLDGDGDLDVLSAAAGSGKIAWHQNMDGLGGSFHAQTISTAADGAWAVIAADLDGDGDLDVLSASQNDNKIAWYENTNGAGVFGAQRIVSTSADVPVSIAAADLDGDGDVDVVSASAADDKVAWYENGDGAGTFGPQQVISAAANEAASVSVGDLDGDGDLDVASASTQDDKIAWYENLEGVEGFGPEQVVTTAADFAVWLTGGDLDGDGDLDLLSANALDDEVTWFENLDGAGSFGPKRLAATVPTAVSVVVADVDGDGDTDAFSASLGTGAIAWHENLGDDCDGDAVPDACEPDCDANGRADACDLAAGEPDCNGNAVPDGCDVAGTSADCAGEGVPDECEPDCNGNLAADSCDILAGTSADCAGEGVPDECEPDCNGNLAADSCDILAGTSADCAGEGVPDECEPDCNGNAVADSCDLAGAGSDCNGNGLLDECDVAGGGGSDCNGNGELDACETATAFAARVVSTLAGFARSVHAADMDGDGDTDLLSASSSDNRIAWYENLDGAGGFGPQQIVSTAALSAQSVFAADVDGDRDADVLAASFLDDTVAWYENLDGHGTFGPERIITSAANGAQAVFAADVDGDSDVDALSASSVDDTIAWYESLDGAGTFGPARNVTTTADGAMALFAADLDGDSDTDLLAAAFEADTVAWYENLDGDGSFGAPRVVTAAADGARSVFATDVDGDLDADVLVASQNDDTIAWYQNLDGDGTFGPEQIVSTLGNGASAVRGTDVDGDGDADVVAASFFDNTIAWHENLDGAGTFGPRRVVSAMARGVVSVFAADVDGDGDLDLQSASSLDSTVAWYENEGDDCNGNGAPDGCDIAGGVSADCDGNAVPDECAPDCNGNGVADGCDITGGPSDDCDADGVPDECEPDCNGNGAGDDCDIAGGASVDCDENGFPDDCEPDCNGNGVADACDLASGASDDCDGNAVPDECDPDCGDDGVIDACDADCNSNEIPDGCEPDCNDNGVADACDLGAGTSVDCSGNGVPDECDTSCPRPCDADGDLCRDELDAAPADPNACSDVDADGCDDCVGGLYDPATDGPDADADGICNAGDCSGHDASAWFEPGAIDSLRGSRTAGVVTFTWNPPDDPGAQFIRYDTLRSTAPGDFGAPATCLEFDQVDTATSDGTAPPPGGVLHYLVRVENDCLGSDGNMGADSSGTPRTGKSCP